MIKELSQSTRMPTKKISTGYKAIKASCPNCKIQVIALKKSGQWHCPTCDTQVRPQQGEREFTKSAGCFIFQGEMADSGVFPKGVTSLRVLPAYPSLEKTMPHSYTKWAAQEKKFCTSRDGETAERYDKATSGTKKIQCSKDCPERVNKTCKANATFYVRLADADTLSIYGIPTSSEQSIRNIISTLNQLSRMTKDGSIPTSAVCTLVITMKKSDKYSKEYQVLQLFPPSISLTDIQRAKGTPAALTYDTPMASTAGMQAPDQQHHEPIDITPAKEAPPQLQTPKQQTGTETERILTGRLRVKEKAREKVPGNLTDKAVEELAKMKYAKKAYEYLTLAELTELWHYFNGNGNSTATLTGIIEQLKQGAGK